METKAVISLAGKQFFVKAGDSFHVAKHLDAKVDDILTIDQVLLTTDGESTQVGAPLVKDSKVTLKVVSLTKGPKVVTARFTAKSRHRRKVGHRQPQTELLVTKIA